LLGVKRSIEADEAINKDKRRKKKGEKRKVKEKMQIKYLSCLQRFLDHHSQENTKRSIFPCLGQISGAVVSGKHYKHYYQ
jgi:hypothetical protein